MVELAENEMNNFIKVWLTVILSLTYCYFIGKIISKGFTRLLAIFPVILLFLILPLNLTSIHFCGLSAFFISWLANFKLLLFAFGKPPLSYNPSLSFPYFLAVSCLPIKLGNELNRENRLKLKINGINPDETELQKSESKRDPDDKIKNKKYPSSQNPKKVQKKSPWNYLIKGSLLIIIVKLYDYKNEMPQKLLWTLYGFHIYFQLEIMLAFFAKLANFLLGIELEPQFNEPLLATSLQDFWGKRWNLMVTNILRPTIYEPTFDLIVSCKYANREIGKLIGVLATFAVSAIYHELIFFYLGRVSPTFEVTWFFVLHGVCLCIELVVKRCLRGIIRVPGFVSIFSTIGFVIVTGIWLFLPPLLRAGLSVRGLHEYAVVVEFVRRLISL